MNGPSRHLSWKELACHDKRRTPYPAEWRATRAIELARAFERIREILGEPILVNSAYRTEAYNRSIGGAAASQHCQGRALDLSGTDMLRLGGAVEQARSEGLIRGVGLYRGFIHIDTRPGRSVTWRGSRSSN